MPKQKNSFKAWAIYLSMLLKPTIPLTFYYNERFMIGDNLKKKQ